MAIKKLEPGPFVVPMPIALIGADIDGRPNFMPAAFLSVINYKPAMVACGLSPDHATAKALEKAGVFSLCVPSSSMVEIVDWCGLHSGSKTDKSGLFEVFRGELPGAPMIEQCALSAECKLVQCTPYGVDTLYVAELVSVYAREECLTDGKPDWGKIAPLLFTFPDPSYWRMGEYVAKAWSVGKRFDPTASR